MSMRKEIWLAWGLVGVLIVLLPIGEILLFGAAHVYHTGDFLQAVIESPCSLIVPALGALIVTRRPGNLIGWIFIIAFVLLGVSGIAETYAVYGIEIHSLPGTTWLAWFSNVPPFPVQIGVLTLPFLYFPNGGLISRRWRPIVWLTVGLLIAIVLHEATVPEQISVLGPEISSANPLYSQSLAQLFSRLRPLLYLVGPVVILAPIGALIARYRRSDAKVRQQIKLIAYVVAISAACFLLSDPSIYGTGKAGSAISNTLWYLFNIGITLGLPIAVVIAILRHGLWDIDRIINRTLVYAGLTASLAVVYILGVLGLQHALSPITRRSDLAIVLTTLAVAALFQPVRHRIQAMVDHRFFRRKYDAQRILSEFGLRVRDEVDLEQLSLALAFAIDEAVQPAHVAVWLHAPEARLSVNSDAPNLRQPSPSINDGSNHATSGETVPRSG